MPVKPVNSIRETEGWGKRAATAPSKLTLLLPAGYQGYKRHFRRGGAEDDGDALSLEDNSVKVKDIALENGGCEFDDISNTEEKKKAMFNSSL